MSCRASWRYGSASRTSSWRFCSSRSGTSRSRCSASIIPSSCERFAARRSASPWPPPSPPSVSFRSWRVSRTGAFGLRVVVAFWAVCLLTELRGASRHCRRRALRRTDRPGYPPPRHRRLRVPGAGLVAGDSGKQSTGAGRARFRGHMGHVEGIARDRPPSSRRTARSRRLAVAGAGGPGADRPARQVVLRRHPGGDQRLRARRRRGQLLPGCVSRVAGTPGAG